VTIQPKRRQCEEADHKMPASPQQQRFYPWRRVDPIFPMGRRGFSAADSWSGSPLGTQ